MHRRNKQPWVLRFPIQPCALRLPCSAHDLPMSIITFCYTCYCSGWAWAWYISPTSWILYGLGGSQLADSQVPYQPPSGQAPTITVGEFVQEFFGYDPGFIWWCPLILFGFVVVLRTSSALVFSYVNFNKR